MIHSETQLSPEVRTVLSILCMLLARTIPSTRIHILENTPKEQNFVLNICLLWSQILI